ncbi:MAG TPA: hypothetical protein PKM25_19145, partial [Candidatus Ozemobacteraceae bacterium]|nr:hypothetical protein [Candidatus Ozemobacteraceae bacterium]
MAGKPGVKSSVAELLDRINDENALEKLVARKAEAVPAVLNRIRGMKPGLSIEDDWLCRVLKAASDDPLGDLLSVISRIDYPKIRCFKMAVHTWAFPTDTQRLRECLG